MSSSAGLPRREPQHAKMAARYREVGICGYDTGEPGHDSGINRF